MKQAILFLLFPLLLGTNYAQDQSDPQFYQGKFKNRDLVRGTHLITDGDMEFEVNLRSKSLRIGEQQYQLNWGYGKLQLTDEKGQFHALMYNNTIKFGNKKFRVRNRRLVEIGEKRTEIGRSFITWKKRTCFVGIQGNQEVSALVMGLFYFHQLDQIRIQRSTVFDLVGPVAMTAQ